MRESTYARVEVRLGLARGRHRAKVPNVTQPIDGLARPALGVSTCGGRLGDPCVLVDRRSRGAAVAGIAGRWHHESMSRQRRAAIGREPASQRRLANGALPSLPQRWWRVGGLEAKALRRWARPLVRSGRGREAGAFARLRDDEALLDAIAREYELLLTGQRRSIEQRYLDDQPRST